MPPLISARWRAHAALLVFGGLATTLSVAQDSERAWLAGDSHIHSHWSPGYDRTVTPPVAIQGRDALYPTPLNARMAQSFGLSWMVTTDHGGPNHAKLNLTHAYAELQQSRELVPDVLQFYGMELNMPAMDHHTLIIPRADFEASALYDLEQRFDANEAFPVDPARRTEAARIAALTYMSSLPRLPLVFANHPSRSAKGLGMFGQDEPWEIRGNIDVAPQVYRGMEGGPGHQAGSLSQGVASVTALDAGDGNVEKPLPVGVRGGYRNPGAHTLGGFDQMAAVVGGLWDSLLGEGRHFWIVATSDSHVHYSEPTRRGSDFWPGEFHKTYVHARKTYDDVIDGLRQGRMFAVAGDLITVLDVEAASGSRRARAGETLHATAGAPVTVTIRLRDPDALNHGGLNPRVMRVDLITGEVRGRLIDRHAALNETTRVTARFASPDWTRKGDEIEIVTTIPAVRRNMYLRVRGTNGGDLEPQMDVPGENPWTDLWFYSNPIFISVSATETQP
jgi:hypothetical protein